MLILRAGVEESLRNYNVVFKGAGVDGDCGMGGGFHIGGHAIPSDATGRHPPVHRPRLVAAGSWWERLPPTQPASRAGNYTSVRHQFTGHSRTARYSKKYCLRHTDEHVRADYVYIFFFRPHTYFIILLNEQEKKYHKYFSSNRARRGLNYFYANIFIFRLITTDCGAREYIINYNILHTPNPPIIIYWLFIMISSHFAQNNI